MVDSELYVECSFTPGYQELLQFHVFFKLTIPSWETDWLLEFVNSVELFGALVYSK